MKPYVENVHPSQLRRAMSVLSAKGVDVRGYSRTPDGMMAILFMLPDAVDTAPDWRSAPRPRTRRAVNWRGYVQMLCVVAIVGGLGYLGYGMMAGELATTTVPSNGPATLAGLPAVTGGMRLDADGSMAQPSAADLAAIAVDVAGDAVHAAVAAPVTVEVAAPWWRVWNQEPDQVQHGGGWLRNAVSVPDGFNGTLTMIAYVIGGVGLLLGLAAIRSMLGRG